MLFSIFNKKRINEIEDLINEIHDLIMVIDEKFCNEQSIYLGSLVSKTEKKMDLLWEKYWDLASKSKEIKIKYIGLSRIATLDEALHHLIFQWFLIFNDKMNKKNLSIEWIRFATNKKWLKLWKNNF